MIRGLKNLFHFLNACLATLFYQFPARKLTVIGVTGTDGKTTTAHLIYEILKAAKKKVSLISTISAVINGQSRETGFHVTTPSPWELQRLLRQAKAGGSQFFVLEVTSHALDQHRVLGTSIDVGVVTNISHEHLDYHGSLDHYKATKAKILRGVKFSILNRDDSNFPYLKSQARGQIVSFALNKPADYTPWRFPLTTPLLGRFNLYNCLAGVAVAKSLGVKEETIRKTIASFGGVPGRMEEVKTDKPFRIFIDFAHKPNALEKALETARDLTKGHLMVVFGCAGLRDRLKRPMMGAIAARIADYIILTAEDPRTEDVRNIIAEIASGCLKENIKEGDKREKRLSFLKKGKKYFWRIPDRQEAINFAVRNLAKKGDLLLICGKGHEKSMCYGKIEFPWDEKKAVLKALYGTSKAVA